MHNSRNPPTLHNCLQHSRASFAIAPHRLREIAPFLHNVYQYPQFRRIPCVFVAEHNPINVKLTMLRLQCLGYRADVAGNGKEAFDAVLRQTYNVVLMVVQMPEMGGIAATKLIRQSLPRRRNTLLLTCCRSSAALSKKARQCAWEAIRAS